MATSGYQLHMAEKANLLRMAQGDLQRDIKIRSPRGQDLIRISSIS